MDSTGKTDKLPDGLIDRARDTYRPGTRIHAELNDRVILLRSLLTEEEA